MNSKRLITLVLAMAMVLLIAACGNVATPAPTGTSSTPLPADNAAAGGVLRIACTAEGANPIGVPWEVYGVDIVLMVPCLETLFEQTVSGEVQPLLAEKYEVDLDNKQIVITLKQGIKFTDGSDFNAEVAAWNLNHGLEANMVSNSVTEIVALDDYSIALKFEEYSNDIIPGICSHSNAIISKQSYDANGAEWATENPVGTGPFKLKSYVRGSALEYEKNPDYWQEGLPHLDGVQYQFIRDVMTQNVALQAEGEQSINALQTTSGEQISYLRDLGFETISTPMGTNCLVPSSNNPDSPLAKLEVRQAISYAIDREALVAARGFGVWTPGYQIVAEAFPGAHLDDSYNASYDVQKAKDLLAQAGYADGFSTTIYAQPGMADRDTLVAIQSMLEEVGITAALEFPDSGGYSAVRNDWEGMLMQHVRALPQIDRTFNFFFGQTQTTYPNLWEPAEMEALIVGAARAQDNTDILNEMAVMAADNMLLIPVHNQMDTWVTKANVKGAGFTEWDSGTIYRPVTAYLEQ